MIGRRLNFALNIVYEWIARNKLNLPIRKYNYTVYGEKMPYNPIIKICQRNITRMHEFKHLDLLIDTILNFQLHIKHMIEKSKNVFYSLRRSLSRIYIVEPGTLLTSFTAAIMPRLTYACDLFSDKINKTRNLNRLGSLRGLQNHNWSLRHYFHGGGSRAC